MIPFKEIIMNLDKNTIIAFLLIGLVFILVQTPLYQKLFFPEIVKQKELSKNIEKESISNKDEIIHKHSDEYEKHEFVHQLKNTTLEEVDKNKIREIIIETNLYKAYLSNLGGAIKRWELKKYFKSDKTPVVMFSDEEQSNLVITFTTRSGDTVNTGKYLFHTNITDSIINVQEKVSILYTYNIAPDKRVTKEFTFFQDKYHIEMKVILENLGDIIAEKAYSIFSPSGLWYTENKLSEDHYYAKAVVSANDQVNKSYKSNNTLYREAGIIDWISMRSKYFAFAMIPKSQKGIFAIVSGREVYKKEYKDVKWKNFSIGLSMPFTKNDSEDTFIVYIGPMHDDLLKEYNVGLEKMLDMGAKIIQPFSMATLWLFKKIHNVVPNYGLVLIIFSILIKIIVSPLTHKSFESMKKMQKLQPKLNELKEKYAKDPQRLNAETMKLYRSEGVNPMGGCLPILLQMPLLWALYIVFRTTIELRQQGFVLWIKDLSSPDTVATLPFSIPIYGDSINILPIVMGLTMILQQKMSVTDPKQKAMIYMMPIFMILIFNSFPSGLNLYYTLFNILSILHQKYLMGERQKIIIPKKSKNGN